MERYMRVVLEDGSIMIYKCGKIKRIDPEGKILGSYTGM